jgi:hypothetical protein
MAAEKKVGVLSCLVVITILMSIVSSSAVISNNKIADIAVSYEGQNLGDTGGQCKAFVQTVIREAGGSLGTGYRQCYLNVGREIQSSEATRGDIIQLNKDSDPECKLIYPEVYPGMHTAIVLENYGGNNFKVVDSNWVVKNTVGIHEPWNPFTWASKPKHGLQVHFYRLGETTTSTSSADLDRDGKVGPGDFGILLSWWGKNPSEATSCKSPDINGDGNVDAGDFGIMLSQWSS